MTKKNQQFAKSMEFLEQEWDSISSESLEEWDGEINSIVHLVPKGSVLVSNKGNAVNFIPIHQHDSDELCRFFESIEEGQELAEQLAAISQKRVSWIKQGENFASEETRNQRKKSETVKILPFGKKTDSVVIMRHLLK